MMRIAFILSGPDISGGTNVIFQHAGWLADQGHSVTLVSKLPVADSEIEWHPVSIHRHRPGLYWKTFEDCIGESFDIAIATFWATFFDLWKIDARRYTYFVQSIESRFYGQDEPMVRSLVEGTYEGGIGLLTEARWIKTYLEAKVGIPVNLVPNGVDKSLFYSVGKLEKVRGLNGKPRVLVEGPVDVFFKNVPETIAAVRASKVEEVWLLTSSNISDYPGVDRVFSRIPLAATPKIYRECDVLVKLSLVEGMFGPPLEMFHCGGTAIVYDVTGHDEYIQHGVNGLVAPTGDRNKVVSFLNDLAETPQLLITLKRAAAKTAQAWPGWSEASKQFEAALAEQMHFEGTDRQALRAYSNRLWNLFRMGRIEVALAKKGYRKAKQKNIITGLNAGNIHKLQTSLRTGTQMLRNAAKRISKNLFSTNSP